LLVKHLGDQTHRFVRIDCFAIRDGNASALLAAMLQSIQPKKRETRYVFAGSVNPEDPALLMWMITKHCVPSLLNLSPPLYQTDPFTSGMLDL
jgi:hypothetical protein